MTAVKSAVRLVSAAAPSLGAMVAERLWLHPPRPRRSATPPPGSEVFEVTVGRRRLTGFVVGEGQPTLLLHGWGGRATDMAPLAEAIAGVGRRAVAVDLPGHGSDQGRSSDLFRMTSAIHAVTTLHGAPTAVVAHSFGASATFAAFPHGGPERVALLAPGFPGNGLLDAFVSALGLGDRAVDRFRRRFEDFAGPHLMSVARGEARIPGARLLVLHDPNDTRTPFAEAQRLVAVHEGAALVPVPDVGHHRILASPEAIHLVTEHLSTPVRSGVTAPDQPIG